VFAGFRIKEAIQIAKLQVLGKEAAAELARRALSFEIRRAYWESVRATANEQVLERNLELEKLSRDDVRNLVEQGMATTADSLAEDARYDQTTLALDDSKSLLELALLQLSTLIGDRNATGSAAAEAGYELSSKPGEVPPPAPELAGPVKEAALVEAALANRPESRGAVAALNAANHALVASRADLYPSVLVTGNVSYADPDPRLFPPVDKFNLTWSAGVRLRYELGGMPGAIERGKAAEADLEKARADIARSRNGIALDVRRCVLALNRSQTSLELTRGLVGQAEESLRVTRQKYDNGLAKNSDVLQAEIAVLRAGFAVESKAIDVEIARADLARAAALGTL
ncbi:MAG TPA: TolC family protein, partial [Rectinemataceae bacterium]|nr:TolC family protein [Rectinemataceae bacterium]